MTSNVSRPTLQEIHDEFLANTINFIRTAGRAAESCEWADAVKALQAALSRAKLLKMLNPVRKRQQGW
jgi:hypothetical protein